MADQVLNREGRLVALKLLINQGLTQAEAVEAFYDPTYEGFIQSARDLYVHDDVQIDDFPPVSEADEGVWVNAWVWVER